MAAFLPTRRQCPAGRGPGESASRARAVAPLAAIASLSLMLAACGGGNDDPPTPTPPGIVATQPVLLASPTPAPTEEVNGAQEYTVQPGDTLTAIADQFGVSLDALIEANDIENPDLIQPGDTLTIPAP